MIRAIVIVALLAMAAAWAPGTAGAAATFKIARPNPALVGTQVDYVNELHSASGGTASLPLLQLAVITQAVADHAYLAYARLSDLGGFAPAPVGQHALSSGGRNVVGQSILSQLPQFGQAGNGSVHVFAFAGASSAPPDQGLQPVPGLGVPPTIPTGVIKTKLEDFKIRTVRGGFSGWNHRRRKHHAIAVEKDRLAIAQHQHIFKVCQPDPG